MQKELGKIQKIDLRTVWSMETGFSAWLAAHENLTALGDELGLDLSLIQTEAHVGDFNVDILAEETGTGAKVIIENQLEVTDHDHLGKLITYAAGHDAAYIVWIFKTVREEHRRAIDWLNENTTDDINFFAIQLELWQIEGSKPAPRFDVVCRPNEWAKTVKRQASQGEHSEGKLRQLEFWTQLRAYSEMGKHGVKLQAPRPQHWLNFSIGSSHAHVSLTINTPKQLLGCELYIPKNKELFQYLLKDKEVIEREIGATLEWKDTEGLACRIIQTTEGVDISEDKAYEKYFEWLLQRADAFRRAFSGRIKSFQQTV